MKTASSISARAAYLLFTQTLYLFDKGLFPHAGSREISDYVIRWCKIYE
ncbi:hypothetical protein UFOVP53_147 [uncultured Caudovirales phage]|uniref:Uncharacterized protein n=1 Tax=uncultured Caudovirales phage TaxID=2100421 RepID=A0A6J5KSP3_9CAUD|nr:hypothetical protein UFOVP53_147 [uncultured Caudovirales phage]